MESGYSRGGRVEGAGWSVTDDMLQVTDYRVTPGHGRMKGYGFAVEGKSDSKSRAPCRTRTTRRTVSVAR